MEATSVTEQLWGGETTKAVDNFPVSGEPVPIPVVRWLGRVKAAAADGVVGLHSGIAAILSLLLGSPNSGRGIPSLSPPLGGRRGVETDTDYPQDFPTQMEAATAWRPRA